MLKKVVASVVVFGAWLVVCQAEMVNYSIPVLTVRSDGRNVISGIWTVKVDPSLSSASTPVSLPSEE